jgi:hypothetical protein
MQFGPGEAFVQLGPLQLAVLVSIDSRDVEEPLRLKGCPEVSACGESIYNAFIYCTQT